MNSYINIPDDAYLYSLSGITHDIDNMYLLPVSPEIKKEIAAVRGMLMSEKRNTWDLLCTRRTLVLKIFSHFPGTKEVRQLAEWKYTVTLLKILRNFSVYKNI